MSEVRAAGDFESYAAAWAPRVEERLESILREACSPPGCPDDLGRAMKYAVLGGGKRLRPLCALAACRVCGGEESAALDAGCAVELVHSYSLVHDDLPALDDDDVRRGRPSCHRAFGEALAILAGDALLAHAFYLVAQAFPPSAVAGAVRLLAGAAGPLGMAGGQADDIRPWSEPLPVEQVESSQGRKTAALFSAALRLGALAAGADERSSEALSRFGLMAGLAFQIADDLLSFSQDEGRLGRPAGSDARQRRPLHPLAAGPDVSRLRAEELCREADSELVSFGERAGLLRGFSEMVRRRLPE